jgi:glutamate synthase (NADPH/NADH) large chain
MPVLLWRKVPVNPEAVNAASLNAQLPLYQVVFGCPQGTSDIEFFADQIDEALLDIESPAFTRESLKGLYPLSMSCRTQVYKGRLNSWEVVPYFEDLSHPEHQVHTLFFHTRFSTNTAPNPMFAQPFRRMAHNGELNTDKKNRLSEDAIARQSNKKVIFPPGQSDSARLDQTLGRRVLEDRLDIDEAILAMMPPAWENDDSYSGDVRDMLEYFSLSEEKKTTGRPR